MFLIQISIRLTFLCRDSQSSFSGIIIISNLLDVHSELDAITLIMKKTVNMINFSIISFLDYIMKARPIFLSKTIERFH